MSLRAATVILALVGCASAPGLHNVQNSKTFFHPFDRVWDVSVALYAENNWAITNIEKNSGLIISDWLQDNIEAGDYGKSGTTPQSFLGHSADLQ